MLDPADGKTEPEPGTGTRKVLTQSPGANAQTRELARVSISEKPKLLPQSLAMGF